MGFPSSFPIKNNTAGLCGEFIFCYNSSVSARRDLFNYSNSQFKFRNNLWDVIPLSRISPLSFAYVCIWRIMLIYIQKFAVDIRPVKVIKIPINPAVSGLVGGAEL